ncbi:MAG: TrkH family potassium uptake protein, partial [Clostridia bacterium]|nr:TrkH family potassium uptake protein [Clostridia bacterium]
MVIYTLGILLDIEAVLMLLPAAVSFMFGELRTGAMFIVAAGVAAMVGTLQLFLCRKHDRTIYAKEGFVIVSLAWLAMTLFGALPFVFTG